MGYRTLEIQKAFDSIREKAEYESYNDIGQLRIKKLQQQIERNLPMTMNVLYASELHYNIRLLEILLLYLSQLCIYKDPASKCCILSVI